MLDNVVDDFARVDILVNNAGITRDKSFPKMTQSMWDEVLQVNLNGAAHLTRAALPGMIEPALETVMAMTPMDRLGLPEEVAAAVVSLACPAASHITGQVISVNGGMYMQAGLPVSGVAQASSHRRSTGFQPVDGQDRQDAFATGCRLWTIRLGAVHQQISQRKAAPLKSSSRRGWPRPMLTCTGHG
jgi:hypothetical protein